MPPCEFKKGRVPRGVTVVCHDLLFVNRYDIDSFEKFATNNKFLGDLLMTVSCPVDRVCCLSGKYNKISAGYNEIGWLPG
jgi:hypothetical protein